ncbi:NDP-hexose 2,3-dehydratase family protein [Streptomyces oceani]|uniref:NDP-hexose 2,3-dehydratase n=1 Tax=Streptomyces oceani TaxID=1075402 RepID=A0A1E7KFC6_9ACTN|nr:NDP-hexose 2,3-dehydratase family protein [Streptomyces oceani]OEV02642.1 NDP-hexose 2,3-dehydratase [Streptomyces oceani]
MTGVREAPTLIRARKDVDITGRLARSAATFRGPAGEVAEVRAWLERRREAVPFTVERIPFAELESWSFAEDTGNLTHRSGRFFTVEGLRVTVGGPRFERWYQPVIRQPEVGILGILAREFDGVLHFLLQAKTEPGNPNRLQLSPTVQATCSNYGKVHQGAAVRYLEHFTEPGRGRVLSDVLQSEHGSWFYRKRNRNMIVEVAEKVPVHEDFRWLTLGQVAELLHDDLTVNMDARSVLAALSGRHAERALHSDVDVLSWLARTRAATSLRAETVPLATVPGWTHTPSSIHHEHGRYFRVVAVSVQAGNREVAHWTQPLFEPRDRGVVAFLSRTFEGVPHVLVRARTEGGFLDTAELGPTVQCTPGNHSHLPAAERPAFLDVVTDPEPSRVRYSALHSEEGGRFLNALSRYLVIDADESQAPLVPPPGFRWVSYGQLDALTQHSHYVSVQARTLLAGLHATPVEAAPNHWAAAS